VYFSRRHTDVLNMYATCGLWIVQRRGDRDRSLEHSDSRRSAPQASESGNSNSKSMQARVQKRHDKARTSAVVVSEGPTAAAAFQWNDLMPEEIEVDTPSIVFDADVTEQHQMERYGQRHYTYFTGQTLHDRITVAAPMPPVTTAAERALEAEMQDIMKGRELFEIEMDVTTVAESVFVLMDGWVCMRGVHVGVHVDSAFMVVGQQIRRITTNRFLLLTVLFLTRPPPHTRTQNPVDSKKRSAPDPAPAAESAPKKAAVSASSSSSASSPSAANASQASAAHFLSQVASAPVLAEEETVIAPEETVMVLVRNLPLGVNPQMLLSVRPPMCRLHTCAHL
jgi:hypothetical protein